MAKATTSKVRKKKATTTSRAAKKAPKEAEEVVVEAPPEIEEVEEVAVATAVDEGEVQLVSRNGKDWTKEFPQVARAVGRLPAGDGAPRRRGRRRAATLAFPGVAQGTSDAWTKVVGQMIQKTAPPLSEGRSRRVHPLEAMR